MCLPCFLPLPLPTLVINIAKMFQTSSPSKIKEFEDVLRPLLWIHFAGHQNILLGSDRNCSAVAA